jgi:hypothetical protein
VLREMLQARYAVTDRLGVLLADEVFFGIAEDSDTSKIAPIADGAGYKPAGYWKDGFRQNRVYAGIDYKVTPALTVTPMYMLEVDVVPRVQATSRTCPTTSSSSPPTSPRCSTTRSSTSFRQQGLNPPRAGSGLSFVENARAGFD